MDADLSVIGQPMDGANTTRRAFPTYTGSATAASGGEEGLAAACRMSKVFAIAGAVISNGSTILLGFYNQATSKLQWFDMAGAEATGDLSGYSGTFEVIGQ